MSVVTLKQMRMKAQVTDKIVAKQTAQKLGLPLIPGNGLLPAVVPGGPTAPMGTCRISAISVSDFFPKFRN